MLRKSVTIGAALDGVWRLFTDVAEKQVKVATTFDTNSVFARVCLFQYIVKLRSLYTYFLYASWHALVVASAAKRTLHVVTTAPGQGFETTYEGPPLYLSIPGVAAITVFTVSVESCPSPPFSHFSVAVSPEEYRTAGFFER